MTGVKKVISGGQVGADIAALRAARHLGIPTGGWAPRGYKCKYGTNMELKALYGLEEHPSDRYPPRTYENVKMADATLRLATNFQSAGEVCTMKAIRRYDKPHLDVALAFVPGRVWAFDTEPVVVAEWLLHHEVKVLNVAGNARYEIEDPIKAYLIRVLTGDIRPND